MSPTKASIARFNPNVLSIPKSPALALGLPAAEDIVIGSTNRPETGVVGNVRTRDPAKSNSDRPEPTLAATPAPATSGLFLTPAENGDTVRQQNRLATTNVSPSRRLGTYRSPNEVTSTGTGGLTNSPTSAELERESQNQSSDPASRAQQATYLDQLKQPTQHDLEAETRWIAKRAQRDELLRSLREIRRETRQIEVQLNPDIRHSGSEKECEEMVAAISLLNSSASSGQKSKPPTLTSMLSSFLPFSRPIVQHSEAPEQDRAEADISHRPVDLENPLPFLTMFTSLAYSEDIAPLAESLANDGNTYRELHNITARSPLSLLTVAIRMVTQTSLRESLAAPLPTIEKLSIDSISPWASVELLPTLQLHARNNEIGSLSNALNTYWLLCLARAECWVRCETSFQHLLDITANKDQENYAETTKLGQGGRKTKRTRAGSNVVSVSTSQFSSVALITSRLRSKPTPRPGKSNGHRGLGTFPAKTFYLI